MKKSLLSKEIISQSCRAGFTLIEALVAIFIFSLALVSLITITSRGVTGVAQARNQNIAQFLAQEGIEMTRNMRDTHFLQYLPPISLVPSSWMDSIISCSQNSPCFIDLNNGEYTLLSGNSDGLVLTPSAQVDMYKATTSNDVKFIRQIYYTATTTNQGNEIQVNSIVKWNNGAIAREVHLVTTLTNWLDI